MIGRTISHYKILEKLGEGGMGVVYKAEDTKLDRIVALKFLAPHVVGSDEEKARFNHEAKAAAALNHTNICTIHEIDEWEGQSFIAMEHVEGESLKAKIGARLLKLGGAVDIVLQVAGGLREAHKKGIVHRDIKPANIMLTTSGQAKIMDFGLAKSPGRTQLTRAGTTVGTMAYMSPEQGRGETVDHRSDIWSLGVVLYETVTGLLPFRGDHEQAIMYSILNESPRPLTSVRSGVPMDLEKVVGKCLEKDPSGRYQHVDDLMVDLKRVAGSLAGSSKTSPIGAAVGTSPTKRSLVGRGLGIAAIVVVLAIVFVSVYPRLFGPGEKETESKVEKVAVLFFDNLGPPEDEYFANGITDAITARLAGIRGLGVISRQSAIQYKGSTKSIREIGEELGVDYILEGTVQRERPSDPTSRVRVIPQLVRVSDDMHVWAGTYDEDMAEVFRVQSEIAERVAQELDVTLLESERRALEEKPTDNLEAYEYYLRGKDYASRRDSKEDTRSALRMYEKAVELDSGFAEAWAALATTYVWLYWTWGEMDVLSKVEAAGDKALQLGPDLPETQFALGYIAYFLDADYEKALTHFREVQRRRPSDDEAMVAVALVLGCQGRWEERLSWLNSALATNPQGVAFIESRIAWTYVWLRRYAEADRLFARVTSLAPDIAHIYSERAYLHLAWKGDVERAGQILQEAVHEVDPRELASAFTLEWPILRILPDISAGIFEPFGSESSGVASPYDMGVSYLMKAEISAQKGREEQALACYDSACVSFESAIRSKPTPSYLPYLRVYLGLACAGRGLKERAIEEGRRAVELMPVSEYALTGPELRFDLAQIYAKVGEYEAAIDELEVLLSIPSKVSVPLLRLDPLWDPLRGHPRFQSLLKKYSGAGS